MATSEIKRGLEGVVVDESSVSKVMAETNSLTYRGYPVQELAQMCSFEEVAYLLWNGELPNASEKDKFCEEERNERALSPQLLQLMTLFPKDAHPMDTLRTAVSFLGSEEKGTLEQTEKDTRRCALSLLSKIPVIMATDYRIRRLGEEPISPRKELSLAENFFHMTFGEVPDATVVKAFEVSLILYAEHGFNASTFTARVVASTLSDIHSAVTAAIGALKGPLHGGANEQVMHMMKEIEDPAKATSWMKSALAQKRKIMGFGHRVYKSGDSRVPTMEASMRKMAEFKGETRWVEMYDKLRETMLSEKNIHPNLDFPAGPAYYLMGFDIDFFTPIFVMSRITGWCAHIQEQLRNNRLIRPLCQYSGKGQRQVTAIESR